MELCDQNVSELAEMLRKGDVSSTEITESVFDRIKEKEEQINAYITTTYEIALKIIQFHLFQDMEIFFFFNTFGYNFNVQVMSGINNLSHVINDIIIILDIRCVTAMHFDKVNFNIT